MPCGLTLGSWLLGDGSPAVITLQFIFLFTKCGLRYQSHINVVESVVCIRLIWGRYYRHNAVKFSRPVCSNRLLTQGPVTLAHYLSLGRVTYFYFLNNCNAVAIVVGSPMGNSIQLYLMTDRSPHGVTCLFGPASLPK